MTEEEVWKSTTELGNAIQLLSDSAEGLAVSFGEASDSSKGWTIASRILSGSGLWKLQNRIRALGQIMAAYNRHQLESMESSLKSAEANIKLSDTLVKLKKSRQILMRGLYGKFDAKHMDSDIVRQFKLFTEQYEKQGYATKVAKHMAGEQVKRMYGGIISEAEGSMGKAIKKMMSGRAASFLKSGALRSEKGGIMLGSVLDRGKKNPASYFSVDQEIFFKRQRRFWGKFKRGQGTWTKIGDALRGSVKFIGRFFQVALSFFVKGLYYFFVISAAIMLVVFIFKQLKLKSRFMKFEESFKGMTTIFGGVVDFLKGIFMVLKGAFTGDGGMFIRGMTKMLIGIAQVLLGGFLLFMQLIVTVIAGLLGAVFKMLGKLPIIGKYIPQFATGGVSSGGLAIVGERGPELVSLPSGARVHSNAQSRRMGGNSIHVHINGRVGASDAEIRDIANKVAKHINLQMNRTGATAGRF